MKIPKKIKNILYEKVLPELGYYLIVSIFSTIRMRLFNDSKVWHFINKGQPVIFTMWHNRLAYPPYGYNKVFRKNNLVAMVSRSKDGRVLGSIIERFGYKPSYGSTSKGGTEAMREMIKLINDDKFDCAITPDGPRGPKYKIQPGVISLAQSTGAPIIPLTYDVKWKFKLKSWDGFYVPLPFNYGVVMFADPIFVPQDISDVQKESYLNGLQETMDRICKDASAMLK